MARSIYKGECYEQVYKMDNFQIEYDDSKKEQNICAVYCSSSGLYFPNTEEEFCKAFIDRDDKFEWKRQRVERAYKHIWIRDITKEFYVRGINSKINSIDKLIDFIKKETEGYSVIFVGSSGGAYIATLLGCVLEAELVYNFSGFFDLNVLDEDTWPLIKEREYAVSNAKWYNLCELIRKSNTKVLYFYPNRLEGDRKQAEFVKDIKNVYSFEFISKRHGIPFSDQTLEKVINMDFDMLYKKVKIFKGKRINVLLWNLYFKFLIHEGNTYGKTNI